MITAMSAIITRINAKRITSCWPTFIMFISAGYKNLTEYQVINEISLGDKRSLHPVLVSK
jgi:hypothetical protein